MMRALAMGQKNWTGIRGGQAARSPGAEVRGLFSSRSAHLDGLGVAITAHAVLGGRRRPCLTCPRPVTLIEGTSRGAFGAEQSHTVGACSSGGYHGLSANPPCLHVVAPGGRVVFCDKTGKQRCPAPRAGSTLHRVSLGRVSLGRVFFAAPPPPLNQLGLNHLGLKQLRGVLA